MEQDAGGGETGRDAEDAPGKTAQRGLGRVERFRMGAQPCAAQRRQASKYGNPLPSNPQISSAKPTPQDRRSARQTREDRRRRKGRPIETPRPAAKSFGDTSGKYCRKDRQAARRIPGWQEFLRVSQRDEFRVGRPRSWRGCESRTRW